MNIHQVVRKVYRGASPVTLSDFAQLRQIGITFTLDLETGSHLFLDGSPLSESMIADMYGIHTYNHPLGEIIPPTKGERTLACKFIYAHMDDGVYVHCKAGVDRTGMVIAEFAMQRGVTRESAIAEMKELGMHRWYYWWSWFL